MLVAELLAWAQELPLQPWGVSQPEAFLLPQLRDAAVRLVSTQRQKGV